MTDAAGAAIRPADRADRDAVTALLASEDLEADFVPDEFLVADDGDAVRGCVRLKPLPSGGQELAALAVHPRARGRGLGDALVRAVVARTDGPVHALALAPDLLADHGFRRVAAPPVDLADKHRTCCADRGAVPMTRPRGPDPAPREDVQARYGAIARGETGAGTCCEPATPYPDDVLARIPDEAVKGLGTGDPVGAADVRPGETVVDLGSGAGVDVFHAALRAGPEGRAVGIDLTPEMVRTARRLADEHGFDNVRFVQAPIEAVPLDDGIADVVVSNCVVNLSRDKPAVLAEARRLLRPGGRLVVSDTVRVASPGTEEGCGCGCGCTAGAWTPDAWRDGLEQAGFVDVRVEVEPPTGRFGEGVGTATVRARAPG